jgi:hypothetical protein
MDARGIMEPNDKPQELSRAEVRHQRKEMKKALKPEKIAMKNAENAKANKIDTKPKGKDQRAGKPIQQARLNNHK